MRADESVCLGLFVYVLDGYRPNRKLADDRDGEEGGVGGNHAGQPLVTCLFSGVGHVDFEEINVFDRSHVAEVYHARQLSAQDYAVCNGQQLRYGGMCATVQSYLPSSPLPAH